MFNGNPLLRYDGYFLLVDAIGQPNLAQRSSHRVRQLLEDVLLGSRSESLLAGDRFLLFYGIVSGLYRTLLSVAILSMLSHLFDAWSLGVLGLTVMVVAALPLVVSPLWAFTTGLLAELSFRNHRPIRLLRTLLILVLLLAVSLIPLPHSIMAPAVVEPLGMPLFVNHAGQLEFVGPIWWLRRSWRNDCRFCPRRCCSVRDSNTEGAVRMHEARVRAMELRRQDVAVASLPEARALLETSQTRLEEFDRELERLTVIAPVSGTLMPPRQLPERRS